MTPHPPPKKPPKNPIITFLFLLAGKQLSSQWIQVSSAICKMPKSVLCSVSPDGQRAAWCNKRTEGVHWLNCWPVGGGGGGSDSSRSATSPHKSWDATIWHILLEKSSQLKPWWMFFYCKTEEKQKHFKHPPPPLFFFFARDLSAVKSIHSVNANSLNASQNGVKEIHKHVGFFFLFFFSFASNRYGAFRWLWVFKRAAEGKARRRTALGDRDTRVKKPVKGATQLHPFSYASTATQSLPVPWINQALAGC